MNILLKTKIYAFLLAVLLVLPGCGGGGGGGSASSPTLVITAQPHDQNVEAGTAVRLTVVASTAASYQWQTLKEGGWTNIAGSTSADLTLAAVSSADDGKQYRVVITSSVDAAIQVTSSIVTLRVSKDALPPGIAVQPANVTLAVGQRGMLSITATGTSLQYLWQSSVDGSFWVNAGAPSDPTLTLTDASLGDSGKMWRVIVSNSAGYATSAPALVTVISTPAATVTVQPADAGVIAGQRATFAAQVTGVPAPALQWQTSADGGTWSNVAGAVDQGFSTPPTSISDSGHFYRLVATNASGTTTSRAAQLSVTPASQTPLIQTQPASTVVNLPAPATFSVVASATPSGTYQWQLSTDGGMSFINITGATSASYTVNPSSISDNNARYRVSVSNTSGSVVSAAAMLSVQQAPTISVQPRSGTWTGGERVVSFNVTASGSPKPSFQWQVSTDGGMNFSEIPDANLPTYSTYKTDAVRGNLYKVRVSNAAGTVVSNSVRFDKINWVYANPRPTGDHLYSVAWSNASTAVAVGSTRTILRTTDAGSQWNIVSEGSWSSQNSLGVAFADANTGVIVESYGGMQRSTDAGVTWNEINSGTSYHLHGIAFRSAAVGVAVGDNGTMLRTSNAGQTWLPATTDSGTQDLYGVAFKGLLGLAVGDAGKMLRTVDGGASWLSVPSGISTALRNAAFVDANTVVAVGDNGVILRSTDAGQHWSSSISGTSSYLSGVQFNGGSVGLVTENSIRFIRTTDGGITWNRVTSTQTSTEAPYAIAFRDANNAIAVGAYGRTLKSTDGGATFSIQSVGVQSSSFYSFDDVSFNNAGTGVAVGSAGTVARSLDRGKNWSVVATSNAAQLNAVAFAGPTTVIAGGVDGTLLRSIDSGANWAAVNSQTTQFITSVAFGNAGVGLVATTNGMVRTTDNGANWTTVAGASGFYRSVAFGSPTLAIAVGGGGLIMRSTDGGITWSSVASGTTKELKSVAFANASTVVAVGSDGATVRSADGGLTWTPVEITLGFSDYWFYGVAFSSDGLGFMVGNFATILRSTDGGLTWSRDASQKSYTLNAIRFVDAHSPIAVGSGMVVLQGIGY